METVEMEYSEDPEIIEVTVDLTPFVSASNPETGATKR